MNEKMLEFFKKSEAVKEELIALAEKYNISKHQLYNVAENLRREEQKQKEQEQFENNKKLIGKCFAEELDKCTCYYKVLGADPRMPWDVKTLRFNCYHEGEDEDVIDSTSVSYLEDLPQISITEFNEMATEYLKRILEMKEDEE